jgi:hypothetical protein
LAGFFVRCNRSWLLGSRSEFEEKNTRYEIANPLAVGFYNVKRMLDEGVR